MSKLGVKITGELLDVYFLYKQDEAEVEALIAAATPQLGAFDAREKYAHMLELTSREQAALWTRICTENGLDPKLDYMLDRSGEVLLLPFQTGAAV